MRPVLLLPLALSGQLLAQPSLTAADLSHLKGGWTGELTYINYTDGSPSTIPATLLFEPAGEGLWRIGYGYTEEPQANELDTVALSADGRTFDGFTVFDVEHIAPDSLVIRMSAVGEDDERPASISKKWAIGTHRCTMRKEVMFLENQTTPAGVPLFRHEYRFQR